MHVKKAFLLRSPFLALLSTASAENRGYRIGPNPEANEPLTNQSVWASTRVAGKAPTGDTPQFFRLTQ